MRVYLDTNIWIYAYEHDPVHGDPAKLFLQKLRAGRHRIASSLFVLSELLVLPTRRKRDFILASYQSLFSSPELVLLPYDLRATRRYAELRAQLKLKPLDALHLAASASAGVDLFVTQDSGLLALASQSVPGIGRITDLHAALA